MLQDLRIRSLGIIDDATLEFVPGLNVLTGETGAGKTMVVQGLGLLFGARGDAGLVRPPAQSAAVEGHVATHPGSPAARLAAAAGAEVDDGLILVRTISAEGRSRAHVGGRAAPVGLLAEIAENLIALHGQADQWRLRSPEEQRALLDAYGGPALAARLDAYRRTHAHLAGVRAERDRLAALTSERDADLMVLRAGVEQIEAIDPQPGEDEALRREDRRLAHADELRSASQSAAGALLGDDGSGADVPNAGAALGAARSALATVSRTDQVLDALADRLAEIATQVSDLGGELSAYSSSIEVDDVRLAAIQQRRADLAGLTRRHGGDVGAVLEWLATASDRLRAVDTAADDLARIEADERRLVAELELQASQLSALRASAAAEIATSVGDELGHLAMGGSRFRATVAQRDPVQLTASGADVVEFSLRANPGLPFRPIVKAASGGELSRVMLAIEVALGARVRGVPTYVFDEVDAGVGGKAALDVGARLARLARSAQVIVVTHLPQVAAFADRHLVVTKSSDGIVSASDVVAVDGAARDTELARMMAGGGSRTALAHARELRERALHLRASWDD